MVKDMAMYSIPQWLKPDLKSIEMEGEQIQQKFLGKWRIQLASSTHAHNHIHSMDVDLSKCTKAGCVGFITTYAS